MRKYPEFSQALHALALLDAGEQQSERALIRLRKALAIDPSYAEGYITFARVLNLLARHQEALDAARKGVELRPDLWQGHYELGLAALSLGQENVAQESSARIEKLAGLRVPELRLLRAGLLLKQSKLAEAKTELLAFLELAPQHPFAALAQQTLHQIDKQPTIPPVP